MKQVIAGNWKMNKLNADAEKFVCELKETVKDAKCEVVVCVPFTSLAGAVEGAKGSNIKVGAQNVHWADNGAFTGEISASMLVEAGVEYVVVGHSERRQYFNETNETVAKRTIQALKYKLKPIVCIGELLNERQGGLTEKVLSEQIIQGFNGVSSADMANVVVAYEPVWAIGTGVTASNEQAEETVKFCRSVFATVYGEQIAKNLVIQYGGSMNDANAKDLLNMPNINGGLVGGASLDVAKFTTIINSAK